MRLILKGGKMKMHEEQITACLIMAAILAALLIVKLT